VTCPSNPPFAQELAVTRSRHHRRSAVNVSNPLGAWTLILWVCALVPSRAFAQVPRTTANQGLPAHYGWQDPDGTANGLNSLTLNATDDQTVAAGSRVYNTVGDPTAGANLPAYNGNYTVTFKLIAITPNLMEFQNSTINALLTTEYSINSGASWTSVGGTSQVTASRSHPGVTTTTQVFTVTLNFSGGGPDWIRLKLRGTASGNVGGGQVKVQAYASSGWASDPYAITWSSASPLPPGPPTITLRNHNGDNWDRSMCLTAGAGEAAAWGCGDLVVTHGLPGYPTMGRERSVTLLYNSAQAVPKTIVAATVNESNLSAPTSVFVRLSINGVPRDSATYNGWGSAPYTRQVVLAHDGTSDSSGIYPFTLLVRNQYTGGTYDATINDTMIIVNRSASRYGTGWSLVGVEELRLGQPGNKILWVGGDGSAKVYRNINASAWVSAAGAFRDTLFYVVPVPPASPFYYRRLRHGVEVRFNALGQHIATTGRTGQTTNFSWTGSPAKLTSIQVPPFGVSGNTYTIVYDAAGKVDSIADPAGRGMNATVTGGRLMTIRDPDTFSVQFGYDAVGRMTARTTRRGFTTKFFFAQGLRVDSVKVPLNRPGTSPPDTATTIFYPWDEKGLAVAPTGQTAVDTALAYTKVDGPRPAPAVYDTAEFRIDRWGAPTKITDPLGYVTTVLRGNPLFPALDTQVTYPDGRIVRMYWDARGNLTQMRDSTSHIAGKGLPTAVTSWVYNSPNTKDSPSQVTDPEGLVSQFTYNTWGILSDATAPNTHVTHFDFVTTGPLIGLVRAVTEQQVPAWDTLTKTKPPTNLVTRFGFNSLGNVVADTSPMGRVRAYTRGYAEWVTHSYDPALHHTEYVYDQLNRVTQIKQHVEEFEPTYPGPLVTTQTFAIDVLQSISDPRMVTRNYAYDAANRMIAETDDYSVAESTWYNRAGMVDSVRSRLGFVRRNAWNAGGRLTKLAWPAFSPLPKDSILYTYDEMGRVLTLTEPVRDRKIVRTYFARGFVKSEVQSLVNGTLPSTMTYGYDRNGRRMYHIIGTVGVTTQSDSLWYRYAAGSGDLAAIGVRWRNPVTPPTPDSVIFAWDALGRRDQVTYRHGVVIKYAYDRDGMLRLVCGTQTPNTQGGLNALNFTVYHRTVDLDGQIRQTTNLNTGLTGCGQNNSAGNDITASYDSRHQLLRHSVGNDSMVFQYDSSGNRTRRQVFSRWTGGLVQDDFNYMSPNHNRLRKGVGTSYSLDSVVYTYLADGSRSFETPYFNGFPQTTELGWRQYFYDALGRTSGTKEIAFDDQGVVTLIDNSLQCGYDPLGRQYNPCESSAPFLGFDGQNVVRSRQDNSTDGYTFVHGSGTDDPLFGYHPGLQRYLYYVTDGQGRQYVVADTQGIDMSGDLAYYGRTQGGKFAGGTTNASSFSATRNANQTGAVQLSAFRSRFYDQRTGRWTQEDPIGIAGGLNLYGYVGNNPVMFTDPFGLKVCYKGTESDVQGLKEASEQATGSTITLDDQNCVSKVESNGNKKYDKIRGRFQGQVDATETYSVQYDRSGQHFTSHYDAATRTAYIIPGDVGTSYNTGHWFAPCWLTDGVYDSPKDLASLIAHELIGHGGENRGAGAGQPTAIHWENQYHGAVGQPQRCGAN